MDYQEFIKSKADPKKLHGFKPVWLPDFLFDFQQDITDRIIRKGRAAVFADCGL